MAKEIVQASGSNEGLDSDYFPLPTNEWPEITTRFPDLCPIGLKVW